MRVVGAPEEILRPEGEWDVVLGTGNIFPLRKEYVDAIIDMERTSGGFALESLKTIFQEKEKEQARYDLKNDSNILVRQPNFLNKFRKKYFPFTQKNAPSRNRSRSEGLKDGFNAISLAALLHAVFSPGALQASDWESAADYDRSDDVRMHNVHNIDKTTVWIKQTGKTVIFSVETKTGFKELHRSVGTEKSTDDETKQDRTLGIYAHTNATGKLVSAVIVIKDHSVKKRQLYNIDKKENFYAMFVPSSEGEKEAFHTEMFRRVFIPAAAAIRDAYSNQVDTPLEAEVFSSQESQISAREHQASQSGSISESSYPKLRSQRSKSNIPVRSPIGSVTASDHIPSQLSDTIFSPCIDVVNSPKRRQLRSDILVQRHDNKNLITAESKQPDVGINSSTVSLLNTIREFESYFDLNDYLEEKYGGPPLISLKDQWPTRRKIYPTFEDWSIANHYYQSNKSDHHMAENWATVWLSDAPHESLRKHTTASNIPISSNATIGKQKDRIVFLLDGEYFQITTIFDNLIDYFNRKELRIEFVKFPAACSLSFQPNDLMVSFKLIKFYISHETFWTEKFEKMKTTPVWVTKSKELTGMKPASRHTFVKLLRAIPYIFANAFRMDIVVSGWNVGGFESDAEGFARVNTEQILTHWQYFRSVSFAESVLVKAACCRSLALRALSEGILKDRDITDELPFIASIHQSLHVTHRGLPVDQRRNEDNIVENQQRALWLNHSSVITRRQKRIDLQAQSAADKSRRQLTHQAKPKYPRGQHNCSANYLSCRNKLGNKTLKWSNLRNCSHCEEFTWVCNNLACQSLLDHHISLCNVNFSDPSAIREATSSSSVSSTSIREVLPHQEMSRVLPLVASTTNTPADTTVHVSKKRGRPPGIKDHRKGGRPRLM